MPDLVLALLRCTDLRTEVDPLTGAISREPRTAAAAASDAAALEHALRIAELLGAEVLALSVGGPECEGPLREALALGCEVLRVSTGATYLDELVADEQALARSIVWALQGRRPVVTVCADRSADRGTGALPAFLAHELELVQAPGLVALWVEDGELHAERRLDHGRRERMRVPRPAVCSVEAAGVRLRRAPLPASLAAARAVVPVVDAPPVPARLRVLQTRPARPRPRRLPAPTGTARERLLTLTGALQAHEPPTVVGPVDAPEAADVLLDFLTRHGYVSEARTGWTVT